MARQGFLRVDFLERALKIFLRTPCQSPAGKSEDFHGALSLIHISYAPENYALQLAQKQDFRAFYWKESALRREKRYPPFTVILRVVFSGESEEKTRNAAQAAQEEMDAFLTQKGHMADVVQSRAVEAPVRRIRGQYRWQLFVKVYFKADISAIAGKMEELAERAPEQVRAELEINPTNLS